MLALGIVIVILGALLLKSSCSAKLTPSPHDMRMEDFLIYRKEWNKKDTEFPLNFSKNGEVMKLAGNGEESLQRYYIRRYQFCYTLSNRYIIITSIERLGKGKMPVLTELLVNGLCRLPVV